MELKDGIKTFYAKDRKKWRDWLSKNHTKEESVWLIMYKKTSSVSSIYYDEAVEEALCFGWIDSKPNKRDEESFYQFFSKRNPKSKWSKLNKSRVEKLLKEVKIEKAGMEMIEIAKKNGTWNALDEVEALVLPPDLKKALNLNKKAQKNFEAFPRSIKRGILEWILSAKKPETRLKRIEETISQAEKNIRANQWRQ